MASEIVIPEKERWTYSDYVNLTSPDSFGFEVIRGELFVAAAPKPKHQWVAGELEWVFRSYIKKNKIGQVFSSPVDVLLGIDTESESIVQPDLLFIFNERLDIVTDTNINGAPDLMVEVLSTSSVRRDRVDKMKLYVEFGVRNYWIIDAEQKVLEAFDLTGEVPTVEATLAEADVFKPSLFPNLVIPLENLWYPEKKDGKDND